MLEKIFFITSGGKEPRPASSDSRAKNTWNESLGSAVAALCRFISIARAYRHP